jgi:hypothetical protein
VTAYRRQIHEAYMARASYHRWCAAKRFPIVSRFRSYGSISDAIDREAEAQAHKAQARVYLAAARQVRES